jgi:threonine aldolase
MNGPGVVDLRSDTVTTPTPEMRRAMAEADVGDDAYGEDPTVRRLETLAAALLGMEAGLYVPSGTMANQIALRTLGVPGTEVLCGARSHVLRHERAAGAMNAGVQLRALPDDDGRLHARDVEHAVASIAHHLPSISALFLENTYMPASGRPASSTEIGETVAAAHTHGLAVHCDGARIWNASVALGVPPSELVAGCDTAMFCLSKGLSAPVGSVLCGARARVDEARGHRARLGGQMRQAGVIAAAGVVALETMVDRLADDHARARRLAEALAAAFPGSVDPSAVATNIVCAPAAAFPAALLDALAAEDVLAGTIDADTVRFVTHRDVDDAGIDHAIAVLRGIAARG